MDDIVIREARDDEAEWIVAMICRMVEDVSHHGGHAPGTAESAQTKLTPIITSLIQGNDAQFFIAESSQQDRIGVVGAELEMLGGALAPRKLLDISVIYVLPQFRRCGIATRLLSKVMSWGKAAGYEECSLNVVSGNPAKLLYEKQGFLVSRFKMVRPL